MKIGIIGCGNMGSAIARGILSKKVLPFNNIYVSDKDSNKTKALHKKFGIRIGTNKEVLKKTNIIILAVKPQDLKKLLKNLIEEINNSKQIVSVMAGVSISKIGSLMGKKIAVTRAMPNMGALVGKSLTCICHNRHVRNKLTVEKIFDSIGEVIEIDENKMDAVTAVSGSGPAYFFYLAECLRDAACKLGIKKEKALRLAVATLIGSGALLDGSDAMPKDLRMRITSKKGTTERALDVLRGQKFKTIIEKAVREAANRSKELSKGA